ncbi:MAG: GNAT family N-acetyltransferase [Anaerolineae bacterium]|nr:GNAT family N-acetyltransferase [Anaerolineae bacterium]
MKNIRTATAEDVGALAALTIPVHQMHVEAQPDIFKPLAADDPDLLAFYEALLADPDHMVLIAESDNTPIGYLVARYRRFMDNVFFHDHTALNIDQISVAQDARGQGYGKQLMQAILAVAKDQNLPYVVLDVWDFNTHARDFYLSLGFKAYHSRMYYHLD